MRRIYFLLLAAFMSLLYGCSKSGNKPASTQQKLIIGKWNLQKQSDKVYVDGALTSDTMMLVSKKTFSYVQFEAGNNFNSVSYYNSGGIGSISLSNVIAVDTVRGTFNFDGPEFKLSTAGLGGFWLTNVAFGSGPVPVIHLVSQSAQIVQLTAAILTLHLEYTTTETLNTDTKTYKNVLDYYYTK